jgi:chaperonin cofactor prefoldin
MSREQETMSDTSSSIADVDDVYNEIMYHVLGQFLVTKDNKNIATVLDELTTELKIFRKTFSKDITAVTETLKSMAVMENNENDDSPTLPVSSELPTPVSSSQTPIFSQQKELSLPTMVSSVEDS